MNSITNKETRQSLLQQLRTAVGLQIALWNASDAMEKLLGGDCDVTDQVMRLDAFLQPGNELSFADLDAFLGRLTNLDGSPSNLEHALRRGVRRTLLYHLRNAGQTLLQYCEVTTSIAATIGVPVIEVVIGVGEMSVTADKGTELNELDLHAFLGEPEAINYISVGLPTKTKVLLTSEQMEEFRKELGELRAQAINALEPVATQLARVTEDGEIVYTDEAFTSLEETAWRWMLNCKRMIAARYLQRLGLDPDITKPENESICFQLMEAWAELSEDASREALAKAAASNYYEKKALACDLESMQCNPLAH